ncbi:granulin a [Anoplopoma fimbria]|uniref:granulin a n=1 Tax=Anoplopoma fimbria TaxID=229290 RepID=UPI0023EDEE35|nr:granulin a [Anoplopoma fimbria]
MQKWVVICLAFLALVGADECPDGGVCEEGQTCCNDPANGYECCPLDQAECCGDHTHCCPAGTVCNTATSSCLNLTGSVPWVERVSTDQLGLSKSFRMIKTYMGEEDDNVCPDQSRCPAEFSCLRALTKFGCCPLAQGVPCSDGKHCCPEGHQCSADSRSCIKKELVTTVLCNDGVSECPDETTCCETPEGKWGCCPTPKAVCCEDKTHCCPEGSTCDVEHSKCISSATKKEMPMWAKFPARTRADWENQKEGEQVTAKTAVDGGSKQDPKVTTVSAVPPTEKDESSVTMEATGNSVPTITRQGAQAGNVTCDPTHYCPDDNTCCKTATGEWACCGLPEAVCCDDHESCCPAGTTCNTVTGSCDSPSGSTPIKQKKPAFAIPVYTTGEPEKEEAKTAQEADDEEEEEDEEDEERIQCDPHTTCPQSTTCCFMTSSHKWGCCPLPEAMCCADGNHCCPVNYQCDEEKTTCTKGEVVIPWYTKLPASISVEADPSSVQCDSQSQCPEDTTCCRLSTGEWGCCPIPNAVCCQDKEHCCPQGYTCNMASNSCQKLIMLQLEAVPLTQVYLPERQPELSPSKQRDVKCDDTTSCQDGETCCRTSATSWGCCPYANAVCCSDMLHCCPTGYTCDDTAGCIQNARLHWHKWHMFFGNKKRALVV